MLTPKQEKFVQNLIKGMSQREAYRNAYPSSKKWKENTVDSEASKMLSNPKIFNRYNELQNKTEKETIMTAIERKEWLTKVITGEIKEQIRVYSKDADGNESFQEKEFPSELKTKVKAMDILNKMSGEYVTKIEGDLNTDVNINIELTDE